MTTEAIKCQSCQHWLPLPTFPGKGECRRFPPQVFGAVSGGYGESVTTDDDNTWPWTGATEWCGEWKVQSAGFLGGVRT